MEATPLEALSEAQLWTLVYRGMAWQESARLRELTARGKQAPLPDAAQAELAALHQLSRTTCFTVSSVTVCGDLVPAVSIVAIRRGLTG